MRKVITALFVILCMCCVLGFSACTPDTPDTVQPTITLSNKDKITVKAGEEFDLPSYTVSDDVSAADKITVVIDYCKAGDNQYTVIDGNKFKFDVAGKYVLRYTATDEAKNSTYEKIDVEVLEVVIDGSAPEISINSKENIEIEKDTVFKIPSYTVTDDMTAVENIKVTIEYKNAGADTYIPVENGEITFNEAGDFVIRFVATDEAGNSSEKFINVAVKEVLNKVTITGSDTFPEAENFSYDHLIDGNIETSWAPHDIFRNEKPWLNFEYETAVRVNKIVLHSRYNDNIDKTKTVRIEIDGMRYSTVELTESTDTETGKGEIVFEGGVVTKNIKFIVTDVYGDPTQEIRPGFAEIEIETEEAAGNAPTITVDESPLNVKTGEEFSIPQATSDIDAVISVSLIKEWGTEESIVESDKLTVKEAGKYYLIYRAVTADGYASAVKVELNAETGMPPMPSVNVTVSGTFNEPSFSIDNLTDNNHSTQWAPGEDANILRPWVMFTYDENVVVNSIRVWGRGNGLDLTQKVLVRFSDYSVYEITLDEKEAGELILAEPVRTKEIYFEIVAHSGQYPGFTEIEVGGYGLDGDVTAPVIDGDKSEYQTEKGAELVLRDDIKATDETSAEGNVQLKTYWREAGSYALNEITDNKVVFDSIGEYFVVYVAADEAGNKAVLEIKVTVVDEGAPSYTVEVQSTFPEAAYNKDHLFDNDKSTAWAAEWSGNEAWITITYDRQVQINEMKFYDRTTGAEVVDKIKVLTVIFGEGEEAVTKTVNFDGNVEGVLTLDTPVNCSVIRIEFTELVQNTNSNPGLTEIEIDIA